jgi:Domain of unknown function (DUF6531)
VSSEGLEVNMGNNSAQSEPWMTASSVKVAILRSKSFRVIGSRLFDLYRPATATGITRELRRNRWLILALATAFFLGDPLLNAASPVAIFSDLNGTFTPGGYIVGQYSPGNSYAGGPAFRVVGQNYKLTQIQALLSFSSGVNNMTIGLYTDSGGVPGTLLESWNLVNVLTPSPSIVTLASVASPTLTAGQRYWIIAGMANPTSVGVWWVNPLGEGLQGFGTSSRNGSPFSPGANSVFGFDAFSVSGIGDSGLPPADTFLGSAATPANPSVLVAEPVNSATGNYYSAHTDLAVRGRGLSFTFRRHYNSMDPYSGPMGNSWTHTYNAFLTQNTQAGQVTIKQSDGSTISFVLASGGKYMPATVGLVDTLGPTQKQLHRLGEIV